MGHLNQITRAGLVVSALLALAGIAAPTAAGASFNHAANVGYGGYVDTAFDIGAALKKQLAMTARFMPKYPYTAEAPIFGIRGEGEFYIGIGNYRELQRPGFGNYTPDAKLVVRVGSQKAVYRLTGDPGKNRVWRHLAVNVFPSQGRTAFLLYVDGQPIHPQACLPPSNGVQCPGFKRVAELYVPPEELATIKGFLRIGQTTGNLVNTPPPFVPKPPILGPVTREDDARDDPGLQIAVPSSGLQFYGLIDDVGLFEKALVVPAIKKLADAIRLTGTEKNVLAAYTFDDRTPDSTRLPANFRRKTTFVAGRSARVRVSRTRSSKVDGKILADLPPSQKVSWTLPFTRGQEWLVVQGNSSPDSSHNGYASFSWDFALADRSLENSATCGQDLHAVASGSVYAIDDSGTKRPDLHPDGPNVLKIKHNAHERSSYLHIQTGSVRALFTTAVPPPPIAVTAGRRIGRVGTRQLVDAAVLTGCHLHLGSEGPGDDSKSPTLPAEFSNYEVKDPATGKWKAVARGAPATGQIIRRP